MKLLHEFELDFVVFIFHEKFGVFKALIIQVDRKQMQLVNNLSRLLKLGVVGEHATILNALHEFVKIFGDFERFGQVVARLVQVLQLGAHFGHGARDGAYVLVQLGEMIVRALIT